MMEEVVPFRSFDGVRLEGDLVIPGAGSTRGLVLLIHGVTATRHESGFYDRIASSLGAAGYASFRFDWRCHGVDSGRPMSQLSLAGVYNDIDAAVRSARGRVPDVPLALIAASFSGGITTSWSYDHSSEVQNVILLNPVLDYIDEYVESQGYGNRAELNEPVVRSLDQAGEIVSQRKPFSRAVVNELRTIRVRPHASVNYWILHGDIDTGVNIKTSKRFVQEHPATKLLVFPGAEHGFSEPGDPSLTSPRTIANHEAVIDEITSILGDRTLSGTLPLWDGK